MTVTHNDNLKLLRDQIFAQGGALAIDLSKSSLADILGAKPGTISTMINDALSWGVGRPESSSIEKVLKEIGVNQSHHQGIMEDFSEKFLGAVINQEELSKLFHNNLNGISTKLSDILPKENFITPSYASLSYFPSPQELMADELAESNRVNKEILDEMRKQRLGSLPEQPRSQGEILKEKVIEIRKLNLAFDVLDAATERCLTHNAPHDVYAERKTLTAASVVYYLKHSEFGNLGKFTIVKTGDKKSEIEIMDSPVPEDQEAVIYFHHQSGWRVQDGSYRLKLESGPSRIPASDLIPLLDKLHQLRQEHLSKILIPAYFNSLQDEDIWLAEDRQNFSLQELQSTKPANSDSKYKSILDKVDFEDKSGWDMILIQMWNDGYSRNDISKRVHVSDERVTNRISELRRILGKYAKIVLPYDKDRKKQLLKSRGTA